MAKSKMYILVREVIPIGYALNSTAHASLACYLKYKEDPRMVEWLANSFAKVTCKVTEQEFCDALLLGLDHVLITESALKGEPVAIAFCPCDYPAAFKSYHLYR